MPEAVTNPGVGPSAAAGRRGRFRRPLLTLSGLLLLLVAFQAVRIVRYAPVERPGRELVGVIHVHSIHSDGGADFATIARKASAAGLDFVVMTDHGSPSRPDEAPPLEPVFIIGTEISTDAGHMVAIGYRTPSYDFSPVASEAAEDVHAEGGFCVVAHPFHEKVPWLQWPIPAVDGMEVLNADSEWRDISWGKMITTLPAYWLNPIYFHLKTMAYPAKSLAAYDREAARHRFVLSAGLDAHANLHIGEKTILHLPDYLPLFRTLKVRIPGAVPRERDAIVAALRSGAFYVSLDGLAGGGGFTFTATAGTNSYGMGQVMPGNSARFDVVSEPRCRARLLCNGREVAAGDEGPFTYEAAIPGAYRVEVYRPANSHPFDDRLPWILSNPIFLGDDFAKRPDDASAPIPAVREKETITPSLFRLETDHLSEADFDGAHLHFKLGDSNDPRAWPVIALGYRRPLALMPSDVISLRLRSDRTYRVWVQIHVGDLIFRASVKCRSDGTHHVVSMEDFHPVPESGRLTLDPTKTTGLFLVVDQSCVPRGTEGDIWLDTVAVGTRAGDGP